MRYNSRAVDKYLNKNKSGKKSKGIFYKIIIKFSLCIIILLCFLIYVKDNNNLSSRIHNFLNKYDISLAKVNNWYQKNFGDIIPFQKFVKGNSNLVFDENLKYNSVSKYKSGVKLAVDQNYLVPCLKSGIVVFIGNKDDYGNTIIVEQVDGVDVWYGNVKNSNVSLYDYVSKGEFLGEVNNKLYLVFQKDGNFLNYKQYLE